MKQLLTALSFLFLTFLFSSCGCKIDCADCETLDEENCECVVDLACRCSDGIQNGNETGIDCGGDCPTCFDCTTDNCVFLSGGISSEKVTNKKWIFVPEGITEDWDWTDNYFSNGYLSSTFNETTVSGTWKFDNPSSPTEIIQTFDENKIPSGWTPEQIFPLVMLTSDTLRMKHYDRKIPMLFILEQ